MPASKLATISAAAAMAVLVGTSAKAIINCNNVQIVQNSLTLNDDYEQTTASIHPCIRVEGSNVVLNMGGHKVTCKVSGGCGAAIQLEGTNQTVKNGNIVSGTGAIGLPVYKMEV